jgi:hypothetical protein
MKTGLTRNTLIVAAVALVGVALVGGGVFTVVRKAQHNRRAIKEFNATAEEINATLRAKAEGGDTVQGAAENARKIQDAMGRTAAKLSGDDAKALRAGERLLGAMRARMANYEAAYAAFMKEGAAEPKSLTSAEAIDTRIALLKAFELANEEFREYLKDVGAKYRVELNKEGYPAAKMDETIQGFQEGGNFDTLLTIRATDSELCAVLAKYFQLLRTEWGKWKANEGGAVVFQDDASAETFNGYGKQLQDVADRQATLQEKVLRGRQKPVPGRAQSVIGTP